MPFVARSPVLELGMAATGGQLFSVLADLRARGFSYDRIAAELEVQYGLTVTGPTVKAWLDRDESAEASQ